MKIIKYLYYNFRYFNARHGAMYIFAQIDLQTGATTPFDYTWGERYMNKVEYFRRRSIGIECTYEDVENEFLDDWNEKFQEAKKRFEEYRKQNPIDYL